MTSNTRQTPAANVITVEQARREGVSPRSLMMVAEWSDRWKDARRKAQAAELRRVAAQLAAANDNRRRKHRRVA